MKILQALESKWVELKKFVAFHADIEPVDITEGGYWYNTLDRHLHVHTDKDDTIAYMEDVQDAITNIIPKNHTSTTTEYGEGTTSLYGHVRKAQYMTIDGTDVVPSSLMYQNVVQRFHMAAGGAGTAGWLKVCSLTSVGGYTNEPITITLSRRGADKTCQLTMRFQSTNTLTPYVELATYEGQDYGVYYHKRVEGTYDIYVQKAEPYDRCHITEFKSPYNIQLNSENGTVATVPEGSIAFNRAPSDYVQNGTIYADDWNNFTTTGVYTVINWSGANGPIAGTYSAYKWGQLVVDAYNNVITQKYYPHRSSNIYFRVYHTGEWGDWKTMPSIGETSTTAYRGDRGKVAYDHSQATGNPHGTDFSELENKPTTLAGYGITDAMSTENGTITTQNWDTLTSHGVYTVVNWSGGNGPIVNGVSAHKWGQLVVERYQETITQIYYPHYDDMPYYRTSSRGWGWGDWKTQHQFVPPIAIGAHSYATWWRIGTFTTMADDGGDQISFEISGHNGYNHGSSSYRIYNQKITFSKSNPPALTSSGFRGVGDNHIEGRYSGSEVKVVSNVAGNAGPTEYTFYVYMPIYALKSFAHNFVVSAGCSFTANSGAASDPGNNSSTVWQLYKKMQPTSPVIASIEVRSISSDTIQSDTLMLEY